jgi:hypothetical protein
MDVHPKDPLSTCFLCRPDPRLVFRQGAAGLALAGLGPISPGYSVVGTTQHVHSLADLAAPKLRDFLYFAEEIRETLTARYGSCLLAEHGNSPLCEFDSSRDKHCFHPHFLLFPGAQDVAGLIEQEAGRLQQFNTLAGAVAAGAGRREYLLVSSSPTQFSVLVPDRMLPSQFARALVAGQSGCPELVSWRNTPNYARALENAAANRVLFEASELV